MKGVGEGGSSEPPEPGLYPPLSSMKVTFEVIFACADPENSVRGAPENFF